MTKYKNISLIINVIAVLAIAVLFYRGCQYAERQKIDEQELRDENNRLRQQKDSLLVANKKLDEEMNSEKQRADSLLAQADKKEVKIKKIYIARDEKILAVDNMDGNKLYGFFAGFNATGAGN